MLLSEQRSQPPIVEASTGGICYISGVVWMVSRAPVLPAPAPAVAGGISVRRRANNAGFLHKLRTAVTAA